MKSPFSEDPRDDGDTPAQEHGPAVVSPAPQVTNVQDGMLLGADREESETKQSAEDPGRQEWVEGSLSEADAERSRDGLSTWAVRVIRKMGEWAVETAAYEGPWEYGAWGPVPRRKLSTQANFLVGEGMYRSWKDWFVSEGVLPNIALLRQAFPEQLADDINQPTRALVRLLLERSGAACPAEADVALAEARARFERLRPSVTASNPEVSRSDAWLVHRLLNGMNPSFFRKVPGDSARFEVEHTWPDALLDRSSEYVLPSVRAQLERTPAGTLELCHLDLRYAGDADYQRIVMRGPGIAPRWLRVRARRSFACTYLMAAEIDRHIVVGHLLTEFVLVGLHTMLSPDHPIFRLLVPFLQYVDVANHIGDKLVWGDNGVMVLGSPLTKESLAQRFAERMGAFDWKGFSPHTRPLADSHYAPLVQEEFWQCVRAYVSDAFSELRIAQFFPNCPLSRPDGDRQACGELHQLASALEERSVPHAPYDGLTDPHALFEASELAFKEHGSRSFSRIRTVDDLHQFCSFVIYCATLGHGWANVRQYDEGGELEYASFGLRARVDAPAPNSDDPDDRAWHAASAPKPCDQANQLLQGYVLSFLPVGNLVEETTSTRAGDELLGDVLQGARSLGARVERLRERVRELAQRNTTGIEDRTCDVEWFPARPNA